MLSSCGTNGNIVAQGRENVKRVKEKRGFFEKILDKSVGRWHTIDGFLTLRGYLAGYIALLALIAQIIGICVSIYLNHNKKITAYTLHVKTVISLLVR